MKGNKKRERLTSEQLATRSEELLKGKELNPNGFELFEKVIKKAATTKPHDLKQSQT
jgi:hypothetical protein